MDLDFDIDIDSNKFLCYNIFQSLTKSFEYSNTSYFKSEGHFSYYIFKFKKDFDIKNCEEYQNLPKEIKNITQKHAPNKYLSNNQTYYMHLTNGELNIKYYNFNN